MSKKRLVILSDYGLDDAVAGAYLLKNKELFDGIDIVVVAGNVTYAKSLLNAKKLVSAYAREGTLEKVRIIETKKVPQFSDDLPSIHGVDGMGDLFGPDTILNGLETIDFDGFLKTLKDGFILLSLGPLTVTKIMLEKFKPSLTLIMAGVVNETPNFNGVEFNQALDIPAYEACLKYPHLIATLDTCRAPGFNLAGYKFRKDTLLNKFINRSIELAEARHPDNSYIYDFITSLYLTESDIFTSDPVTDARGNTLNQLKVKSGFSLSEKVKNL